MDQTEAYPAASTLSRFHETSAKFQRYKILLRRRWWFLLLTAAIAVCIKALSISTKTTEYMAVGKLEAGIHVNPQGDNSKQYVQDSMTADFYGTQIEILESGELRRRALDRVRTLHPELKVIEVEIHVTQTKGSSILNVAAVGEEAKFTRVFLDALLDEFIAFRKDMMDRSVTNAMNKVIAEVLAREKSVAEKKTALDEYRKANDILLYENGRNEAANYLRQLENTLNVYETEQKMITHLSLEDYLHQKEHSGGGAATAAQMPAVPKAENLQSADGGQGPVQLTGSDMNGSGMSRSEIDYLKALNDLRVLEADRYQLLKTFKPAHEMVQDKDRMIESQKNLIDIYKQACVEESERRKQELTFKIQHLKDEINDWKSRASQANEKIVTYQQKNSDFERTQRDYETWKATLQGLESSDPFRQESIVIMERPNAAVEVLPDLWLPLIGWLMAGLGVGSIILLLFDRLDDRMNSFSEFQSLFPSESILGQIPEQSSRGDVTLLRANDDRHLYSEAFRNLRSQILFKNWKGGKPPKLILVTSAVPNEGKTTTVANMAITMALGGARVLLADADLRRGGINELFKCPVTPGFSEVLTSKLHWRDAVQETTTRGLHVLPRGEALNQTSELFLAPLAHEVLKEMAAEYDYVVFDSAPVLVADDTASFAPHLDTTLFVVRISSTMARLTAKALDLLYDRQVNVGGVILNRASTNLKEYTYYNYASYYSVSSQKPKTEGPASA